MPSREQDLSPGATLSSAWVPVDVAASGVKHANDEHHDQPLYVGSGLMELSLHEIPSREQEFRPRATLGSVWVHVAVVVAVVASGVNQAKGEHCWPASLGRVLFNGIEPACNTIQGAEFETRGTPGYCLDTCCSCRCSLRKPWDGLGPQDHQGQYLCAGYS